MRGWRDDICPSQKHNPGKHKVVFTLRSILLWVKSLLIWCAGLFSTLTRDSTKISQLHVGVNILEKSLRRVKYKTKSMTISVSLLLLLPPICPPARSFPPSCIIRYEGMFQLESRLRHGLHHFRDYVSSSLCSVKRGRSNLPTPWCLRKHVESFLDPVSAQSHLK